MFATWHFMLSGIDGSTNLANMAKPIFVSFSKNYISTGKKLVSQIHRNPECIINTCQGRYYFEISHEWQSEAHKRITDVDWSRCRAMKTKTCWKQSCFRAQKWNRVTCLIIPSWMVSSLSATRDSHWQCVVARRTSNCPYTSGKV